MLWNEINYDSQMKVVQKIYELIVKEDDIEVRKHLLAAAYELELWSNNPCDIIAEEIELTDEEYIAYAQENYIDSKSNSILSILFGKKS